eukprot:CAMPEP_0119377640 /NCGR_PEP_ID=MMETSP1334-20130426/45908_1 /TAXON_ID=127549 /ORGANISM="Calcidiscus leptoporus, Strain RCC1130" /LENGTH=314 /DNA_ID=CAMNT_0007396623 /DNA_START=109 /DNA_END=1053 /DNA_ORIENTATION=-
MVAQPRLARSRPNLRVGHAMAAPLDILDDVVVSRFVRVTTHALSLSSLAYFGLVSTAMQMPGARMPAATIASVITRLVGPTTNAQFSAYFSTLVTPASYVFLIWPVIAFVQLVTLGVSILRPSFAQPGGPQSSLEALDSLGRGEALTQTELASIALANAAATLWLFVSSNSLPGALPLASALALPLVPLFSGHPLRSATPPAPLYRPVFQIFSSFTCLASCLALTVECQYGGRVPFLAGQQEVCGCIFLALVSALVALRNRSFIRRATISLALSGVVARRLQAASPVSLLLSPTFLGASLLLAWSLKKLAFGDA